jgi:2-haloacid dehalogenase
MPFTTLIFDLGGVLIDWNPEYVFEKVIPDPTRRKFFFDNICTHDWNLEQDAGRRISDANQTLIAQWPEWENEILAFYGRWEEMLGGPITDTVTILDELREQKKYRLLALTNWSDETFPVALERYHFLHWFEGIVVSGKEKTRKPNLDIYNILLERYGVPAEEAIFIDDNGDNVRAAEKAGIAGLHFFDAESLRYDLFDLGIDIKVEEY